ncbi:MAG: hypothetical protein AAF998_07755 [Bacteroidota bacterium]
MDEKIIVAIIGVIGVAVGGIVQGAISLSLQTKKLEEERHSAKVERIQKFVVERSIRKIESYLESIGSRNSVVTSKEVRTALSIFSAFFNRDFQTRIQILENYIEHQSGTDMNSKAEKRRAKLLAELAWYEMRLLINPTPSTAATIVWRLRAARNFGPVNEKVES